MWPWLSPSAWKCRCTALLLCCEADFVEPHMSAPRVRAIHRCGLTTTDVTVPSSTHPKLQVGRPNPISDYPLVASEIAAGPCAAPFLSSWACCVSGATGTARSNIALVPCRRLALMCASRHLPTSGKARSCVMLRFFPCGGPEGKLHLTSSYH